MLVKLMTGHGIIFKLVNKYIRIVIKIPLLLKQNKSLLSIAFLSVSFIVRNTIVSNNFHLLVPSQRHRLTLW